GKLDMACGGGGGGGEEVQEYEENEEAGEGEEGEDKNLEIDESLFNADDLQDLDEELEKLEV
ncbi:unnamed protein product, partial [Brachionus calyciflorus]